MTIQQQLQNIFSTAFSEILGEEIEAPVFATADLQFGDYQCNAAMMLAKRFKTAPRKLAEEVLTKAKGLEALGIAEIAGPGFLNIRLTPETFAKQAEQILQNDRLGTPKIGKGKTVVVDFSAPNVAKPMHIGHIRSTIIGDSLARIARFLGFNVITDNHIGDWGTQFGMILYGWKNFLDQNALQKDPIAELLRIYREVNALTKESEEVMDACRHELVKLQSGDQENHEIWQQCIDRSRQALQVIYDELDVKFDHWLGESFYHDRLAALVEELQELGLARESQGAICLFSGGDLPDEKDPFRIHKKEGWVDNPAIIRKADGGFLYATTDLATVEYRLKEWKSDAIWYVVGLPQALHFRQIFDACRRWGKTGDFHHIGFGSILGEDRKLMKTRSGDNVGLIEVLDEAVSRAKRIVREKNPELEENEVLSIARTLGIGAVKFAELSQNRQSDYVFSWDRMLSMQGDTAPYLQNSCVRIQSIFRKLDKEFDAENAKILLHEEQEIHLTRLLVRYAEVVPTVIDDFRPNLLANYLLELARAYHSFYEACPVLKAEPAIRDSRLALCSLTHRTLTHGLSLLGIQSPERM